MGIKIFDAIVEQIIENNRNKCSMHGILICWYYSKPLITLLKMP